LAKVKSPTLLIVGGHDYGVIELNEEAFRHLGGRKKLAIVPGATHLFEEPGALEEAARLAADWFTQYLGAPEI
jgi:putative phosphoribosyl transferase